MKLCPGDYVSTEGMTLDQYHAVCQAFIRAGADGEYEYPAEEYFEDEDLECIVWDKDVGVYHGSPSADGRQLTVQEVLNGN